MTCRDWDTYKKINECCFERFENAEHIDIDNLASYVRMCEEVLRFVDLGEADADFFDDYLNWVGGQVDGYLEDVACYTEKIGLELDDMSKRLERLGLRQDWRTRWMAARREVGELRTQFDELKRAAREKDEIMKRLCYAR